MKNNNYKKRTVIRLWMWLMALVLTGGFSLSSNAQVNYSQDFTGGISSWTGGGSIYSGATACAGNSVRYNLYSFSNLWNFVSPSVGTSIGGVATISFDYKIANWSANTVGTPANFGTINVEQSTSAAGPWTTIGTINSANHIVSASCANKTFNFTPTAGALYIRFNAVWAAGDYYLSYDNIVITEIANTPCAGQPTPGNTIASSASTCPSNPVALSLQNATGGSGVTYLWESSPDNATWSPVAGGTSAGLTTTISAPTYFRCYVTCTISGLSDYSVSTFVDLTSFLQCYCASSANSEFDEAISNVVFGTLNNTSTCGVIAPGPGSLLNRYSNFTSGVGAPAVPDVTRLDVVPFSATQTTCNGNYGDRIAIYIDYNHNGSFLDAGETIYSQVNSFNGNHTESGTTTIPATAALGQTLMRVVCIESAALSPCGTYSYGETEDYLINILPLVPCTDPPTSGQALASISTFCETGSPSLNLSLTGNSYGVGQTYQWQYSFDDLSYINVGPSSNLSAYTTNPTTSTYYRCLVTCGLTTVESASVLVSAVPAPVGGVATGPATLFVGGPAGVFDVTGQTANFIWQSSSDGITYTNIPGTANITPINLSANAGGTFYIRALASEVGCADSASNAITVVASIANDNVCGALPLVIGNNGPYTNIGATSEVGEPVPPSTGCNVQNGWCEAGVTVSVWYTFTVPIGGSGRYLIQAPLWDNQLAIYSAADCNAVTAGGATMLQANDDGYNNGGSPWAAQLISHCLVPGQTYFIQLDGYFGNTNPNFFINIVDEGFADPSFAALPASICENAFLTLVPTVAGGTFSGPGVTGTYFDGASAGVGTWNITYALGGNDYCYYSTQSITVDPIIATYYADADGDTYGDLNSSIQSCSATPPVGYVVDATDCNDGSAAVNPAAVEVCNLIDDNCNGTTDEGFDVDGDTYYTCTGDCNDNDPLINPAALEVCNGIDDNCNGLNDDGLLFTTYYADADGDTYGDPNVSVSTCDGAPAGYVLDNTDCNDLVATANPAGTELCNGIDDDCDGLTDEFTEPNAGAISGPNSQCVPATAGSSFFSIAAVPYATSYTWAVPAGMSIVSGQGTTNVFVSWTTLAVQNGISGLLTVTASNACGSGAPSSVAIDINYTAPVTPPSISGASRVCPGESGLYSIALVARATSYTWSVPVGMTINSGQGTNVISVSASGAYTGGIMTVTANNACGNSPVRIKNMGLNTPGVPAVISGPASGVCGNVGVVYSTAGTPAATSYTWSVPSGATIVSGQGSSSISVDFSGGFSGGPITVTGSNLCGSGAARSLSVAGAPGQPGVISGPTALCPGQAGVVYQISTVTGADTYTWIVPGGATITSGQGTKIITVTFGPAPASGQLISVKASNPCGTSSARVLSGITLAFTNCVRIGSSSSNTTLDVYPNPATDRINVNFTAAVATNYTLKMTDLAGRVVYAEQGAAIEGNNMKEINLDQLAGGIYMVILESNGGTQQVRLVVE